MIFKGFIKETITEEEIWVVGEALIDLIIDAAGNRSLKVGGGPANTAKAIARLGKKTFFIGGISTDKHGEAIEEELNSSGVDLSLVYRGIEPTALAIATLDNSGAASYEFELDGTATFAFRNSWLPKEEADIIHIGSVATMLEPGASELFRWASSKSATIVFDPNVRPSIQSDKQLYRTSVERWIGISHVVKLSEDDLQWLYGDESAVHSWLDQGVSIVVVTRADKGIRAIGKDFSVDVPVYPVSVVDTVGAGDTIGAVIVEGVLHYGLSGLIGENLLKVLTRAVKAAAITCSRAGANPPWKDEL